MEKANIPRPENKSLNEWARKRLGKNTVRVDISEFQELKKLQSINQFMSLAIKVGIASLIICGIVIYTTI